MLKECPEAQKVSIRDNMIVVEYDGDDLAVADLIKRLVEQDVGICKIFREQGNLESIFLQITGNVQEGGSDK